jgi:hypothetical protein
MRWRTAGRKRCFVSALGLVLAVATRAHADESDVVVTGSRAGGFTSRARVDDAPREVTDAASLVEPLPGVHVRRFGADDGFATVSIRGSTSAQVSVLFAGVPLTGGADPSLDLATLPLWPGSQARVYRSFAPATLGPGSLGGTLALDPARAGAPLGTEVWAAGGSFGAARARMGDVRSLGGGARLVTALSASRSDGDLAYVDPFASMLAGHDVERARENAMHAALNGLVSWSVPLRFGARGATLTVTTMAQARHQGLPGPLAQPTPFAELDSNRELGAIELAIASARGAWVTRGWARREDLRLRDDASSAAAHLSPSHTNDAIVAAGGAFGWRGRVDDVRVDARVDGSGERFAPGAFAGTTLPVGATRASVGGATDVEWRVIDDLALAGAARVDAWRDADDAGSDATELHPSGHLGAELARGPFTLAAHGGAVARAPSFVERYGNRGTVIGDPSLRTESAWTGDAGVRFDRAGDVRVALELVGFATWADDLITFVNVGAYGRAKATNIGRARMLGGEADARVRAGALDLRASYTGLATTNLAACDYTSGACVRPPLPGRPAHDLVADASYAFGPLRVRWGVDVVAGITTSLTGDVGVPARALHSAGARFDVPGARGLRLALDVRNVFDTRVATYEGVLGPVREPIGDVYQFPLPGRSVLVSVRYSGPNAARTAE